MGSRKHSPWLAPLTCIDSGPSHDKVAAAIYTYREDAPINQCAPWDFEPLYSPLNAQLEAKFECPHKDLGYVSLSLNGASMDPSLTSTFVLECQGSGIGAPLSPTRLEFLFPS